MTPATLHTLADELTAAFLEPVPTVSKAQRIVELAEAQWVGPWEGHIMFRDPVTGSTCCLPEATLSVPGVTRKLIEKRNHFGLDVKGQS